MMLSKFVVRRNSHNSRYSRRAHRLVATSECHFLERLLFAQPWPPPRTPQSQSKLYTVKAVELHYTLNHLKL